jgi:hypothetical protein
LLEQLFYFASLMKLLMAIYVGTVLFACNPVPANFSKKELLQQKLDSLQQLSKAGDLIVRLSDDLISMQVSGLNLQDKRYAHAGIVYDSIGQKWVKHLHPNTNPAYMQTELLDSFIVPEKTIRCGLYRYQISDLEKKKWLQQIDSLQEKGVVFDRLYDLTTDDEMYCSEMIAKTLAKATSPSIITMQTKVPARLVKTLEKYFAQQNIDPSLVKKRTIITIDQLYLRPNCTEIMSCSLKIFPN